MSKLPEALRNFQVFTEWESARAILGPAGAELREREKTLHSTLASKDGAAVAEAKKSLAEILLRLKDAYDQVINHHLHHDETVVEQANEEFRKIYESVWKYLIQLSEEEAIQEYRQVMQERVESRGLFAGRALQRSKDAVEIYTDAVGVHSLFTGVVQNKIGRANADAEVSVGPLKKMERVIEKSQLRPDEPGSAGTVCDISRAMVVCDSMASATAIVSTVLDFNDQGIITVRRAKVAQIPLLEVKSQKQSKTQNRKNHGHACVQHCVPRILDAHPDGNRTATGLIWNAAGSV